MTKTCNLKIVLMLLTMIISTIVLSSCSSGGINDFYFIDNDVIADQTCNELISALQNRNAAEVEEMFSMAVRNNAPDFSEQSKQLIEFVQGDIVSFSSASEAGIGANFHVDEGKRRKEILSAFTIVTTVDTYHVSIIECTIDEFDRDNVGVTSLYIINAKDWTSTSVFRGDGDETPGINIDAGV